MVRQVTTSAATRVPGAWSCFSSKTGLSPARRCLDLCAVFLPRCGGLWKLCTGSFDSLSTQWYSGGSEISSTPVARADALARTTVRPGPGTVVDIQLRHCLRPPGGHNTMPGTRNIHLRQYQTLVARLETIIPPGRATTIHLPLRRILPVALLRSPTSHHRRTARELPREHPTAAGREMSYRVLPKGASTLP